MVATNGEQGRAAVNSARELGVDFIKVYQSLSRDAYFAIADEARRHHMPFAGHLPHAVSAEEAARAGQRSIEHHAITTNLFCFANEQELRGTLDELYGTDAGRPVIIRRALEHYDQKRCAAGFRGLATHGVWRTPTLMANPSRMFEGRWLEDPRRVYIGQGLLRSWDETRSRRLAAGFTAPLMAELDAVFGRITAEMHRSGVGILAGTDAAGPQQPFVIPGFGLHDELELLVKAGLTPLDALRTATLNPARFFEKEDSLGTVEPGKLADLVLLDLNPLENISHTQRIRAVVANGRYFDRAALDGLLSDAKARAAPR
jgi:imidazolonepropionase-like amidohydrolase